MSLNLNLWDTMADSEKGQCSKKEAYDRRKRGFKSKTELLNTSKELVTKFPKGGLKGRETKMVKTARKTDKPGGL